MRNIGVKTPIEIFVDGVTVPHPRPLSRIVVYLRACGWASAHAPK